jgi:phage repressor protein C with HTH and peptisase S24 domain
MLGAIAIEKVFGISAKWLLTGEGPMMTGKRPAIFDQSPETTARFSSFTKEAETPLKRLSEAMSEKGLTWDVIESLGISEHDARKWRDKTNPMPKKAAIAIERAHGISSKWLLVKELPKHADGYDASSRLANPANPTLLPLYPSLPATGSDTGIESMFVPVGHLPFDAEWLRKRIEVPPECLFLTEVDGNSMVPALNPSDLIMVDTSADSSNFKEGIWVFRLDNTIQIKRVQCLGQEKFQAISDNSNYPPFMLEKPFDFIGRMVWSAKRW